VLLFASHTSTPQRSPRFNRWYQHFMKTSRRSR